jgi:SOS response regulatory protein OraA/RecX
MPKEWTDRIKTQEAQKKLEADKIHNLPKEFEHQQQQQQSKQQKDGDKEPTLDEGEKVLWRNVIKRGFWHRQVEWVLEITT